MEYVEFKEVIYKSVYICINIIFASFILLTYGTVKMVENLV